MRTPCLERKRRMRFSPCFEVMRAEIKKIRDEVFSFQKAAGRGYIPLNIYDR